MKIQVTCPNCGQHNALTVTMERSTPPTPPPPSPNAVPAYAPRAVRAWTRGLEHRNYSNSELLDAYAAWARENRAPALDSHQISRILSDQGHERWRTSRERGWKIYPPRPGELGQRARTSLATRRFDLGFDVKWHLDCDDTWVVVAK